MDKMFSEDGLWNLLGDWERLKEHLRTIEEE